MLGARWPTRYTPRCTTCSAPQACRCRISACVRPAARSPRRVTTPWAVRASAASSASGCAISASRCRPSVFRPPYGRNDRSHRPSRRSSTTARRGRAASRRRPPSRACAASAWVRLPVSIRSTSASSAPARIPRISARTSFALPAAAPGGGRLEDHRREALPDDRAQQLALGRGARLRRPRSRPASRAAAGARRTAPLRRRTPAPACRCRPGHRRHERDVGERRRPSARRSARARALSSGEPVLRSANACPGAQDVEHGARGVGRVGGRVRAQHDVGAVGGRGGARASGPVCGQRIPAADRHARRAQVAREAAAGLPEAEERDRRRAVSHAA